VRNVAMAFDAYLKKAAPHTNRDFRERCDGIPSEHDEIVVRMISNSSGCINVLVFWMRSAVNFDSSSLSSG